MNKRSKWRWYLLFPIFMWICNVIYFFTGYTVWVETGIDLVRSIGIFFLSCSAAAVFFHWLLNVANKDY